MNRKSKKRGSNGQYLTNGTGRVIKRCASFDPDIFLALQNYADLYCGGNISQAIHQCLKKSLNDANYWENAERGGSMHSSSGTNSTDVSAPVNTSGCAESNIVLGNANNTSISKKNHPERGRVRAKGK